jgi:transposase InsO family protein
LAELLSADDFTVLVDQAGREVTGPSPAVLSGNALLDTLSRQDLVEVQEKVDAALLARDGRLPGFPPDPELALASSHGERQRIVAERMGVTDRTVRNWIADLEEGPGALVDGRRKNHGRPIAKIDPRVKSVIDETLNQAKNRSLKDDTFLIKQVKKALRLRTPVPGEAPLHVPTTRTLRAYVEEIRRGTGAHLSASAQRSIDNRPKGTWRRVHATRLGELVAIDATPLDAFAMNPATGEWINVFLLIALDLATRSILGWRFTLAEPTGLDAVLLLRSVVVPRKVDQGWPEEGTWRYAGVPETVVAGLLGAEPIFPSGHDDEHHVLGVPTVVPDSVVVDHGKIFISESFKNACLTLGVNLMLGRPYTPTDKSHVERVFDTIKTGFVQGLPGYKGPNLFSRGVTEYVEDEAFFFVDEIDARFAAWVAVVYQNAPHDGLRLPGHAGLTHCPNDAVDLSIAVNGYIPVPVSHDLLVELLPTEWREVTEQGIEYLGMQYDDTENSVLQDYINKRSPYTNKHGKWRIKADARDASHIWFFAFDNPHDPVPGEGTWVSIPMKGWAPGRPFSARTLAHAKRRAVARGYSRKEREAVLDELEDVYDAMRWEHDGLTKQEKRLAAQETAHRAERDARDTLVTKPKPRPQTDVFDPDDPWSDPDGSAVAPVRERAPRSDRTVVGDLEVAEPLDDSPSPERQRAPVFATDDVDEYDPRDDPFTDDVPDWG